MNKSDKEMSLDHTYLLAILEYDKVTGIFRWKLTRSGNALCGAIAGCLNSKGYQQIRINGYSYLAHRLAWFYEYGTWPTSQLDHIDRNKQNNVIGNLREANASVNAYNTEPRKGNSSGVKGVYYCNTTRHWKSWIWLNGEHRHLGCFLRKEDAVKCRKDAELKYLEKV